MPCSVAVNAALGGPETVTCWVLVDWRLAERTVSVRL